jgi:hypothetical protein
MAALRRARQLHAADLAGRNLAQPHDVRGHLDALVLVQELERLVQRQLARRHEPYTISSSVDAVVGCSSPVPRVSVGGTSRSSGGLSESSEVRAWLAVSRHGSAVPSFRCGSWMVPGVRAVGIGERKFRPRERM